MNSWRNKSWKIFKTLTEIRLVSATSFTRGWSDSIRKSSANYLRVGLIVKKWRSWSQASCPISIQKLNRYFEEIAARKILARTCQPQTCCALLDDQGKVLRENRLPGSLGSRTTPIDTVRSSYTRNLKTSVRSSSFKRSWIKANCLKFL